MAIKDKVYLAGPVNGCDDNECKDWRAYVSGKLDKKRFRMVDPMRRDFRGVGGDHTREIVEGDKKDIRDCDIFVANVWQISAGTMMELLYAWKDGCFTIAIIPEGKKVSPWIRYHATKIVKTLDEAIKEINYQWTLN